MKISSLLVVYINIIALDLTKLRCCIAVENLKEQTLLENKSLEEEMLYSSGDVKESDFNKDGFIEGDIVQMDVNNQSLEGLVVENETTNEELMPPIEVDRIELITFPILEQMVQDVQFLAVYFFKNKCPICDEILEGLERIDDECDVFGILLVKINDMKLAKRYGIKTFPALVFYRNGNPLLFEGDIQNEDVVLAWLTDDKNREQANEIDEVNERILIRLIQNSLLLVVLFYDENSPISEKALEELERIDDEVDLFGIDMVKISDPETAAKYNVTVIPTLMYFRKKIPLVYKGDLLDEEKLLVWLTSQKVFELKNEILGVNSFMLEKLLSENEFLAVYFYNEEFPEDQTVLSRLEQIDDDMEEINVTIVKMGDPLYPRKWGVTKLPSVVFFRNRFPNVYRGGFEKEMDILKWLQKNRNKHPQLNIIMYTFLALMLSLVTFMAPSLILRFQQRTTEEADYTTYAEGLDLDRSASLYT